jgi:hypothetical protein
MTELPDDAVVDPRIRIARFWMVVASVGAGLAIAGAILPWVGLGGGGMPSEVKSGIETGGDGLITLALALLVLGLAVRGWRAATGPTRMAGTITLAVGFFILSIPALRWSDFRNSVALEAIGIFATPEIGLYVTALGGLLTIVGGWQLRRLLRTPRPPRPPATPSTTKS